jgi:hypothetical protein
MHHICIWPLIQLGTIAISYLFNQINTGLQVHTKVNESPFNALFLVLLLLQHKHVVVEELLQFFIGEVDAELLEGVVLEEEQENMLKLSHMPLSANAHCCLFTIELGCYHSRRRSQIQQCPTRQ